MVVSGMAVPVIMRVIVAVSMVMAVFMVARVPWF
jgi:hypothetical protein